MFSNTGINMLTDLGDDEVNYGMLIYNYSLQVTIGDIELRD